MNTVIVTPVTQNVVIDGAGTVAVSPSNQQVVIDGNGAIQVSPVAQNVSLGNPQTVVLSTPEIQLVNTQVTDHGDLTGLVDDDHPQYHNDARGDARYQPLDADLTAIAALTSAGFAVRTTTNTWATRQLNAGTAVSISDPAGSTSNPTISLDADLTAIAALTGAGIAVRTGTNTWATRSNIEQGIIPPLPVPNVKIGSTPSSGPSDQTRGPISAIGTVATQTLNIRRTPYIIASFIPEELFQPEYGLLLELMHYVAQGGGSKTKKGYVHPAHSTASGNGSFTHGGLHNGGTTGGPSNSPRPTEWPVAYNQQHFEMNQLHGWFTLRNLIYRNAAGAQTPFIAPIPSFKKTRNARRYASIGYSNGYQPGYFAWRYSIIDPTDPRGKRITGPMSPVVAISTKQFLLRQGAYVATNNRTYTLKGLDHKLMNAWFANRMK